MNNEGSSVTAAKQLRIVPRYWEKCAVPTSSHNLCFRAKIRKTVYPSSFRVTEENLVFEAHTLLLNVFSAHKGTHFYILFEN